MRILFVEDDEALGFVIKDNLEYAGYQADWQKDGEVAKDAFLKHHYDVCVLDVMLPRTDGFTLAAFIREKDDNIPIIFLTAKSLKEDLIKGFQLGGDDYLTKPFNMEELLARIEAILKRVGKKNQPFTSKTHLIGNYIFDNTNLKLSINNDIRNLTYREACLLEYLFQHRNTVLKREEILIELWGEDDYFKGRSLDVFITRLRKYLQHDPNIKLTNIHGIGFRFEINQ